MLYVVIVALLVCVLGIMVFGSYSIRYSFYLPSYCKLDTSESVLSLTFDDTLATPRQTCQILDILKQHDIRATFFVIGKYIPGNEDLLRRIHAEGHLIGNHSFCHTVAFTYMSSERVVEDLKAWEELLEAAGVPNDKLFRPPFGVTNPSIARAVKVLGYKAIGWNVRSFDTKYKSYEPCLKVLLPKLGAGDIVLLHDSLLFSHKLLEALLYHIKNKGFEVKDLRSFLSTEDKN